MGAAMLLGVWRESAGVPGSSASGAGRQRCACDRAACACCMVTTSVCYVGITHHQFYAALKCDAYTVDTQCAGLVGCMVCLRREKQ